MHYAFSRFRIQIGRAVIGTALSSAFLPIASGLNTITGSGASDVGAASVGRPTGTVMIAVPFGIVIVIVVLDFDGRKQYPKSTQLRPFAPVYVAWNVAAAAVGAGVTRVDTPLEPILSQSCDSS
jgi:hypothetical protein